MNSSVKKAKIHQVKKEYSTTNDSSYYGPTLHREEITSSYSSNSGLKLNSSDIEIVMKPSTWKEKITKKKIGIMRVNQVTKRIYKASAKKTTKRNHLATVQQVIEVILVSCQMVKRYNQMKLLTNFAFKPTIVVMIVLYMKKEKHQGRVTQNKEV
eukprot:2781239-Ditylum_brightwellii.AAC.1